MVVRAGGLAVMMARVMKTTGGRLWLKPWGVPKITKANKANFKKRSKRMQENQVSLFSRGGYSEAPGSRGPRHDDV